MKKNLDVSERHKSDQLINKDAQSFHTRPDSFLNQKTNERIVKKTFSEKRVDIIENSFALFNQLMNSYDDNSQVKTSCVEASCFAEEYASFIIDKINNSKDADLLRDNKELFYTNLVTEFLTSAKNCQVSDKDLLVIYAKQIFMFLKDCDVFYTIQDKVCFDNTSLAKETLYNKLFNSFWNSLLWSDLFPSMPDIADTLKENRSLLVDIILESNQSFCLEDITQDYLLLSGESYRNTVLLTSFFDFSVFTWLSHFGIIEYVEDGDRDRVLVKLTPFGKEFLAKISNK